LTQHQQARSKIVMRPGAWLITVQASAVFPPLAAMYFPAGQLVQERDPVLDTLPASQALHAASFMPPVFHFLSDAFSQEDQSMWASRHIPEVSKNFPAPQATHVELKV
jgi:hypothetical protein